MKTDELTLLMKRQQRLHDMMFEAISVIAIGVGVINPRQIAKEALENYYQIAKEKV